MQQPERVFAEIHRVLKPGGVCLMAFSSRLFYEKAIQGWRDNSAYGRVSLVKQYFQCVKGSFCKMSSMPAAILTHISIITCPQKTCSRSYRSQVGLCAGFTEAKVVTEVELPAQSLTGFASIQAKISKLLGGATQQDPFYAVLAYKQQS